MLSEKIIIEIAVNNFSWVSIKNEIDKILHSIEVEKVSNMFFQDWMGKRR